MKKHVSPESFEGKKQRAIAVLSQYSSDDKIADLYDHDQDFSGAIIDLFSPGFEYPDYSYLTIGQALAKAKRSSEVATYEATEDICARLLDSEEHAVEGAVPGIAEEAVELIQRLWRQLQSAQCIDERLRQGHSDRKPPQSRPSWPYVCEHYGLDVSFQYTDMQKEKYYAQLSADVLKNADAAALPEKWQEPSDTLLGYADDNSAVEGIPPKWVRYGVYLAGTPAAIDKTHYVDTIPPTFKSWMDLVKAQAVLGRGSYTLVGRGEVVEKAFGDLSVGDQFFDPDCGEDFVKLSDTTALMLTGGAADDDEADEFEAADSVQPLDTNELYPISDVAKKRCVFELEQRKVEKQASQSGRTGPDALSIAYMGMGFGNFCHHYQVEHGTYPSFDGQLEAMSEVINHTPLADCVADYFDRNGTHPGVWLYEVAEPFGEALAMHLHAGTLSARNGQSIAVDLLRDIMASTGYDVQELAAAFSNFDAGQKKLKEGDLTDAQFAAGLEFGTLAVWPSAQMQRRDLQDVVTSIDTVANAVLFACKRHVENGRSLANLNLGAIREWVLRELFSV